MTNRPDLPRFANLRDGGNLHEPADLEQATRALLWMRAACLIGFVALMAYLWATKGAPQAAHDAVNHEVMR